MHLYLNNNNINGYLIYKDKKKDLALIYTKKKLQALELFEESKEGLDLGLKVMYLGFPQGGELGIVYDEGVITVDTYYCMNRKQSGYCYATNLEIGPGSSGSPVFNSDGKVLGAILSYSVIKPFYSTFIGVDSIKEFINEASKALEKYFKNKTK